jgi:hypothetical protein
VVVAYQHMTEGEGKEPRSLFCLRGLILKDIDGSIELMEFTGEQVVL